MSRPRHQQPEHGPPREATRSRRSGPEQRSVLACADVNALGRELGRTAGRRRIGKRVIAVRGEHEVHEAGRCDEGAKLSFQESTGNSAGPERNVLFCPVRDRLADDDVRNLQTPAGLEDTVGLAKHSGLIRAEVDHSIRNDDVDTVIRDG